MGRVGSLKRQYGWERTRIDSLQGARTWTGQERLTSNLVKSRLSPPRRRGHDHRRRSACAWCPRSLDWTCGVAGSVLGDLAVDPAPAWGGARELLIIATLAPLAATAAGQVREC